MVVLTREANRLISRDPFAARDVLGARANAQGSFRNTGPGQRSVARKAETLATSAHTETMLHALTVASALLLATSVLAGCGGLSAKQRLARREATQLFPHVGLGSGHPKITSIEIRGGNWADVIVQVPLHSPERWLSYAWHALPPRSFASCPAGLSRCTILATTGT